MICPKCGKKTRVMKTIPLISGAVIRQRVCLICKQEFFTKEVPEHFQEPSPEKGEK